MDSSIGVFLVVNDGLLVDLVNLWVLQCIICKSEQAIGNVLTHYLPKDVFFLKRLIEYHKCNKASPIRTHVECVHPKLIATKKLQFTKKSGWNRSQFLGEGKNGLGYQECNKKTWSHKSLQLVRWIEIIFFLRFGFVCIYKGYMVLSICKNI